MLKIIIMLVLGALQIGANLALQPVFDASNVRGQITCGASCD
jgi:hypothetical protein